MMSSKLGARSFTWLILVAMVPALACTGTIGAPKGDQHGGDTTGGTGGTGNSGTATGTGTGAGTGGSSACAQASTRRIRRMSQREYFNVVADLLGPAVAAQGANMLPLEPTVAGFDNQDTALQASPAFQEGLANVAEKLAAQVDATKVAPCATVGGSTACIETFVRAFARKAFGRNPTDDEVRRLLGVAAAGDSYAVSIQLVVETILQSPNLLYATELGPDAPPASPAVTLTQQEIASQLSLLLTGTRPDADLLSAADQGRLSRPDERSATVTRLLATPKGKAQLQLFVKGWIDLGPVTDAPKSPDAFPAFTPAIAAAMQEELDFFIDAKVAGGQGTFRSLLNDPSTHVPTALGPIYAGDAPNKRGGILALSGVLTYHSADQHSGPVERGLLVRRQLFCQDVPPPPASVLERIAQNPIDPTDKAKTTRQKYEQHKTEAFCAACHNQFDSIGFGMEEMDGLGRYRTVENGLPVDTSGVLSDTDVDGAFVGVRDLSLKLAQSRKFEVCFSRQFFRFAESRVPTDSEACVLDSWTNALDQGGDRFDSLVLAYVTDAAFIQRKEDR
jgi:hypothetical protein